MRDVVIPYNTMSYDTVKPPSNGWLGGTPRGRASLGPCPTNGISKQVNERLNERPHRLPGKFLTELGQFAEQVDQAALFGAIQAVVSRVEITDQRAGKRLAQDSDDDVSTAVAIGQKQGQTRIAEAPGPGGLAVDAPAGFSPWTTGDWRSNSRSSSTTGANSWPPQCN